MNFLGLSGFGTNHAGLPFGSLPRRAPGTGGLDASSTVAARPACGKELRLLHLGHRFLERRLDDRDVLACARWSRSRGSCPGCARRGCASSRTAGPAADGLPSDHAPQRGEVADLDRRADLAAEGVELVDHGRRGAAFSAALQLGPVAFRCSSDALPRPARADGARRCRRSRSRPRWASNRRRTASRRRRARPCTRACRR